MEIEEIKIAGKLKEMNEDLFRFYIQLLAKEENGRK